MINETSTMTNILTGTIVPVTLLMVAILIGRDRKRQSTPKKTDSSSKKSQ